jgi:hypothetical protein
VSNISGPSGVSGPIGPSGVSGPSGPALLRVVAPPASSTAAGIIGEISYDSSYVYICVATNTWRKVFASIF